MLMFIDHPVEMIILVGEHGNWTEEIMYRIQSNLQSISNTLLGYWADRFLLGPQKRFGGTNGCWVFHGTKGSLAKRQAFHNDLENWVITNKDQLMTKMMGDDVDEIFQQMNGTLPQIGQKHFTQDQTWSTVLRNKMNKIRHLFVQE